MSKNPAYVIIILLFLADIFVFKSVLSSHDALEVHFLNIGQGDSALIRFPSGEDVLVDGGPPNGKILTELGKILPLEDRYIDLVISTHPDLDHFGGFIDVLDNYDIGAIIGNGRYGSATSFETFLEKINKNGKKYITLKEGDTITLKNSKLDIISPNEEEFMGTATNDASIVFELESYGAKFLFTGDISSEVENRLVDENKVPDIDILKVAHHGSRFSSTASFLDKIKPEIAVISVGKNSYGHPTEEAINRLSEEGSKILRTDYYGTIRTEVKNGHIFTFTER
ncbi:MAG: hypothetical protein COU07_00305 [Candidatus Harrisonbacteria bacterium CG10_big_fil_rev_8_21_14_0_10_40_38]|uniref:Metallo-beta-lactamase domain-containing protein n=1 Tax=Candidatus Harrisonbacteria bacterium CG10_big_fil_rev_8_21_14_0_10_40_38 TaxID=1974583 RepID=A0A2H0USD3_9BACT|nr:MAG: hypothetical protein COU07_00305 [Candidatus Harrisonbacteria bacterium CG10_big_fil_rev_8_21_14_0_10_40_38]